MLLATTAFEELAHQVASSYGLPEARMAVVAHPLGGIAADDVLALAESAVEPVLALVSRGDRRS